jgi:2-(1,2-epoxy-1,2-dihydrophenyl)acetyl-CoA isomerase
MTSTAPPTENTADILVARDGEVGIVTINRPRRLNAVTPSAGERLSEAFRGLEADPRIRAVVLTGAGRGFCAGADISGDTGNARDALIQTWNPLIRTMLDLEVPIIAAVNGVAAGAGASLALACDLRVAASSARIQLSFTKIGLLPDAGLTWLLPRIVGLGRANELAMLARDLPASEALQWGLVNRVSEDGTALESAVELAREIAALSNSVTSVKRAHQRSFDSTLSDQLAFEADTQGWLQGQPDFTEATEAFGEKRAPTRTPRVPGQRPE